MVDLQNSFLIFLKECKERGFHTALETSGLGTWEALSGLVDYLDLVFYDVKHLDSGRHKELTGLDNGLILDNLQKLSNRFFPIVIRIPLVPGANDSREDQMQMYQFVARLMNIAWIEIMPYHRLGLTKYEGLGRTYDLASLPSLNKRELSHLVDLGKDVGLEVRIGST